MDVANQSLNLSHFVRRLVPRWPFRSKSDGELVSFQVGGISASTMVNRGSQRMTNSGAFFEVSFKAGIVVSAGG